MPDRPGWTVHGQVPDNHMTKQKNTTRNSQGWLLPPPADRGVSAKPRLSTTAPANKERELTQMPTRSGANYHERFSTVDGKPCCHNGCPGGQPPGAPPNPPCECAPCPLCDERVPGWILTLESPYMANGVWVGPHCMTCDMELFDRGLYSGCVRFGGGRCYCARCADRMHVYNR